MLARGWAGLGVAGMSHWPSLGWEGRAGMLGREGSVLGYSSGHGGEGRIGTCRAGSGGLGPEQGPRLCHGSAGGQGDPGSRTGGVGPLCGTVGLWWGQRRGDLLYGKRQKQQPGIQLSLRRMAERFQCVEVFGDRGSVGAHLGSEQSPQYPPPSLETSQEL